MGFLGAVILLLWAALAWKIQVGSWNASKWTAVVSTPLAYATMKVWERSLQLSWDHWLKDSGQNGQRRGFRFLRR